MIRSPFFVIEDAVSPAKCEVIIDQLGLAAPSLDEKGDPIKHERLITDAELASYLQGALQPHVAEIEERYQGEIHGFETALFQQYFENAKKPCEPHGCDNARYLRKKWVKVKDTDLVGYLWLKDFNSGVPLDPRYEVYGGKLEFPAYDFSLVPQRGTIVIFPGGPHFITAISPVLVGSLEQVKFSIKLHTSSGIWLYQPENFPGTWQDWFTGI
jgi:hypothetical protein